MSDCESLYDNIPDRFIIDKFHEFSRFIMFVAIKFDIFFALWNKEKQVGWRGERKGMHFIAEIILRKWFS